MIIAPTSAVLRMAGAFTSPSRSQRREVAWLALAASTSITGQRPRRKLQARYAARKNGPLAADSGNFPQRLRTQSHVFRLLRPEPRFGRRGATWYEPCSGRRAWGQG